MTPDLLLELNMQVKWTKKIFISTELSTIIIPSDRFFLTFILMESIWQMNLKY